MSDNRIAISENSAPFVCERCGYEAVHIANLVDEGGAVVGRTMVCTSCHAHRRDGARLPEPRTGR